MVPFGTGASLPQKLHRLLFLAPHRRTKRRLPIVIDLNSPQSYRVDVRPILEEQLQEGEAAILSCKVKRGL